MQSGLNVHIHETEKNIKLKGFIPKSDIFIIEKKEALSVTITKSQMIVRKTELFCK